MKRLICKLFGHRWSWSEFEDENGRTLGFLWLCDRDCGEGFFDSHQ